MGKASIRTRHAPAGRPRECLTNADEACSSSSYTPTKSTSRRARVEERPSTWSSMIGRTMTDELKVAVEQRPTGAILYTKGYINNVGGEEIANRAYELMENGSRTLLLNLRETKIVNSIGISILIEIIEKMIDKGGKIAFCCLTPVIHKTFQIMGLANYAAIYNDEAEAVSTLGL